MTTQDLHEAATSLHEFARELHGTAQRMQTEGMQRHFAERAERLARIAHELRSEGLRVRGM